MFHKETVVNAAFSFRIMRFHAAKLVLLGALTANVAVGFRGDREGYRDGSRGRSWIGAATSGSGIHRGLSTRPSLELAGIDKKEKRKDDSAVFDGLRVVTGIVEAQNHGKEFGEIFGVKKNDKGDWP